MLRSWMTVLVVAACAGLAPIAMAEEYPSRPVKIIVPFGAGGPADVYARFIGQYLQETLKQPFLIDNRPGAGSLIGTSEAAKAAPDGSTLLMMSNTQTANETLMPGRTYQLMRDFVPIASINFSDLVMVTHPSVPAKNVKEFIALLNEKPGALNYASSGAGTPYHLAGELFKATSGTNIQHVPHKGSGDARISVIAGHVHMMLDAITTMAPNVKEGQVRALGTTGAKRSSVLPDVPTIAEAGLPGYVATIWLGLMAPKGTPPEIVAKLNAAVNTYLALPSTREAWAKQGAEPLIMTPAQFEDYVRKDVKKWADVITSQNIKVQ